MWYVSIRRDLVVERAEQRERTRGHTVEDLIIDPLSTEGGPDLPPPGEDDPTLGDAPIHHLHDEILLMVFSYLSLPEKVRLERGE